MNINRWRELALTFPVVADYVPREALEDPTALDAWFASSGAGSGLSAAVRFLLHVWNYNYKWEAGPFNLGQAMSVWDDGQRGAFAMWAENPVLF